MKDIFDRLSTSPVFIKQFCEQEQINLLVVFGSFVQNRVHKMSDLDLALQFSNPNKDVDILDLIYKLTTLFNHQYSIDPVILTNQTGVVLRHEIFSQGNCLFESKPNLFMSESLRSWHLFQDARTLFHQHHKHYMEEFLKRHSRVA